MKVKIDKIFCDFLQTSTGETLHELKRRRIRNADVRKVNRETYSQVCDLAVKIAVSLKDPHLHTIASWSPVSMTLLSALKLLGQSYSDRILCS